MLGTINFSAAIDDFLNNTPMGKTKGGSHIIIARFYTCEKRRNETQNSRSTHTTRVSLSREMNFLSRRVHIVVISHDSSFFFCLGRLIQSCERSSPGFTTDVVQLSRVFRETSCKKHGKQTNNLVNHTRTLSCK